MQNKPKVLLCDDDRVYQLAIRSVLKNNFDISSAYHSDEAIAILKNRKFDFLILDIQMRTIREGLEALPRIKSIDEDLNVVILSGHKDFEMVREALRLGAVDYLSKDAGLDEIQITLQRVLERKKLVEKEARASSEILELQNQYQWVGSHPKVVEVLKLVERAKKSFANVLIEGETGTGKEVIARLLRKTLPDASLEPFVSVDSSTIHAQTAESILFGHEKGAFTGADSLRRGIFESANGGVVFFDEIGNMSLEIQSKLMRVIQEKEIVRLGSARAIPLEFRVVSATNKPLEALIRTGLFKDDLYQRLNVISIQIPPLRERKTDIPLLLEHFSKRFGSAAKELQWSEEALEILNHYSWPGNVRELSNLVAYLYAVVDDNWVDVADLPSKFRASFSSVPSSEIRGSFYDRVAHYEREVLANEYRAHGGNISRMAFELGMDRSHLYTKLRLYKIHTQKPQPSSATLSI